MSKISRKLFTASAALLMLAGVGASANSVNVNASHHRIHRVYRHHTRRSAWKHYAPRTIRGYWATKHHHQVWGLTFLNSGVAFNPSGAAISNWSHPIYKADGHHAYSIKPSSHSYNNAGRVRGKSYYIKVRGHKIYVWTNGRYIGKFHKSSRSYLFD